MGVQAGTNLGVEGSEILVIGRTRWSLGALGPILKALGIGFALGVLTSSVLTLVAG